MAPVMGGIMDGRHGGKSGDEDQAQAQQPGKQGGTGLGLAIVKKIAEDHGGRVDVESSKAGSRFTLVLPQGKTDEAAAAGRGDPTHGRA